MKTIILKISYLLEVIFNGFLSQFNGKDSLLWENLYKDENKKIINLIIDEMIKNNETTKDLELSNKEKVTLKIE